MSTIKVSTINSGTKYNFHIYFDIKKSNKKVKNDE